MNYSMTESGLYSKPLVKSTEQELARACQSLLLAPVTDNIIKPDGMDI